MNWKRQPLYFQWKEPFASIFGDTLLDQEQQQLEDEYLETQEERA